MHVGLRGHWSPAAGASDGSDGGVGNHGWSLRCFVIDVRRTIAVADPLGG